MRPALFVLALLLAAACRPELALPPGATISCESGSCPGGWVCVKGTCRDPNSELPDFPANAVSFVSPSNGALDVSVSTELVVAFNFDVVPESVPDLVGLVPERDGGGGAPVPLRAAPTGLGNVFHFVHEAPLDPVTTYRLEVRAGVQPLDESKAVPMETAFQSTFVTGASPDLEPPAVALEGVEVDATSQTSARLSWRLRPVSDAGSAALDDVAGVLVVRQEGGPVQGVAPGRQNYSIGTRLGSAEVIASTQGQEWVDVTRKAGVRYGYALYAFDGASNYTAAFQPPYISADSVVWCTDLEGTARVVADQGRVNVLSGVDPVAAPAQALVEGGWESGVEQRFDQSDLEAQATSRYWIRAIAFTPEARTLGPVAEFWAPGLGLSLVVPQSVNLDREVEVGFEALGWPGFEAQVDQDPSPGVESWGAATAFAAPPLKFRLSAGGSYRVRVRPAKPGCPALGPEEGWTLSPEFATGTLFYVRPAGDDSHDGQSIASAKQTIQGALDAVRLGQAGGDIVGQVDVLVAEGDYPENVWMTRATRLLGGYSASFDARDPAAHPSRLSPVIQEAEPGNFVGAVTFAVSDTSESLGLDGFLVQPSGGAGEGEKEAIFASGCSPTISHNSVDMNGVSGESTGIMVYGAPDARIENNLVSSLSVGSTGIGIQESRATLVGNEVHAPTGIQLADGAQGEARENRVLLQPVASATGILVQSEGPLLVRANAIEAEGSALTSSFGIQVSAGGSPATQVRVEGNTIHAGHAPLTVGVDLSSPVVGVVVANNLINAGQGAGSFHVGVRCYGSTLARAVVASNTVFQGDPTSRSAAVYSNQCAPVVVDNLFFGEGAWTGLFLEDATPPASFEHNVFMTQSAPTSFVTSAADLSGGTLPQAVAQLCAQGAPASGNAETDAPWTDVFVTPFASGERGSFTGCDWHLEAGAPAAVRAGGKDASQASCGGDADPSCAVSNATQSCGEVTVDFDGRSRAAPYSVGAFQP